MKRLLVLLLLLWSALICYSLGYPAGSGFFLVLGLGFELLFWRGIVRLFRKHRTHG